AVRKSQGSRPIIEGMNSIATSPSNSLTGRKMLNKVPEVTLYFWLIKVLCTTVGETAADYLSTNVGWGADTTMVATGALLAALLAVQFSLKRYVAPAYWACVVVISVFGTQITDKLTDTYNVPLTTTTPLFAAILAFVFAAWYAKERTLSIHSILTVRREAFYWLAILFTFALGTAAGDLVAEKFTLGYAVSVGLFAGVIALVAVAHFRFGLNAVLSFCSRTS
ncbi:MAG: COG4705 family protein, partial [Solirubrobacteraceae bacterium]